MERIEQFAVIVTISSSQQTVLLDGFTRHRRECAKQAYTERHQQLRLEYRLPPSLSAAVILQLGKTPSRHPARSKADDERLKDAALSDGVVAFVQTLVISLIRLEPGQSETRTRSGQGRTGGWMSPEGRAKATTQRKRPARKTSFILSAVCVIATGFRGLWDSITKEGKWAG